MRAARTVVLTAASALAVTGISVAPAAAAPDVRMAPAPVEEVLEHVTDFGMLYGMAGIGDQLFVSESRVPDREPVTSTSTTSTASAPPCPAARS